MVKYASLEDGKEYDKPFFSIATSLTKQLSDATELSDHGKGIDAYLKANGWDGMQVKSTKSIKIIGLTPHAMAALPAILQDTYDTLSLPDKPPLKFLTALAIEYTDANGNLKPYSKFFDDKSVEDETLKADLSRFMKSGFTSGSIKNIALFLVAASPEETIEIPAARMGQAIATVHQRMFDRERYEYDDHETEGGLAMGYALESRFSEAADRLLGVIADVYGAQIVVDDKKGVGQKVIVRELGFEAMEKGEMPDRYMGRGNAGKGD